MIEIAPEPSAIDALSAAIATAKASDTATLIHIHSDPLLYAPDGGGWWDVPVAEVSTIPSTQKAREDYLVEQARQRPLLG